MQGSGRIERNRARVEEVEGSLSEDLSDAIELCRGDIT
jgi:hypothetical protein